MRILHYLAVVLWFAPTLPVATTARRWHELRTNRPLYLDRDSQLNHEFSNVSYERRSGYGYHTTAPADLLDRDFPAWRSRLG